MDQIRKPIVDGEPAGYSASTITEKHSISTFEGLVNKNRILPEIKFNDKTPNFDGYLYLLDQSGYRTGALEVQVKTLPDEYFDRPRWSFERPFMVACERTVHPTLLVAVNNRDKIGYWQHISIELLTRFSMECKGESLVMEFPVGNIVDGQDEQYLSAWQAIVEAALEAKFISLNARERINELEIRVNELKQKTEGATLPSDVVNEIHIFLNAYNGLFEHDFKAIRDVLYSAYWKIGTVVGGYTDTMVSHLLLPARFSDNSPLIRQFKQLPTNDLTELFVNQGAITLSMYNTTNPIKSKPIEYAYELIRKDAMAVLDKTQFSIDDPFAAAEYIIGFIDTFSNYLGIDSLQDRYNLAELLELLDTILPAYETTVRTYREGMTNWLCHIDSYQNKSLRRSNAAALRQIRERIESGFKPPLAIELNSSLFDMALLRHYIRFLQGTRQEFAYRLLKPFQGPIGVGSRNWQAWDRVAILENLKIIFEAFPRLYATLLQKHFPVLKDLLGLRESFDLEIFTVKYPQSPTFEPTVVKYELKVMDSPYERRRMFFLEDDRNWPIDISNFLGQGKFECIVDGRTFELIRFGHSTSEFFSSPTPASLLVHQALKDSLTSYFEMRTRTNR